MGFDRIAASWAMYLCGCGPYMLCSVGHVLVFLNHILYALRVVYVCSVGRVIIMLWVICVIMLCGSYGLVVVGPVGLQPGSYMLYSGSYTLGRGSWALAAVSHVFYFVGHVLRLRGSCGLAAVGTILCALDRVLVS